MEKKNSKIIFLVLFSIIAIVIFANIKWDNIELSDNYQPILTIETPDDEQILRSEIITIIATAYDDDIGDYIDEVIFWVSNETFTSAEREMTNIGGDTYRSSLSILNYTSGYYRIYVKASDSFGASITKYIDVHFRLIYEIEVSYGDINYEDTNVMTGTMVIANTTIQNNATIENLDLKLILPTEFADADNYEIVRGFKVYNPYTQTPSYQTSWQFNEFNEFDLVSFEIRAPTTRIIEESLTLTESTDLYHYEGLVEVYARHNFQNITCFVRPNYMISSAFDYVVYQRVGNDYILLDSEEINLVVDFRQTSYIVNIYFDIPSMIKGETFNFLIVGEQVLGLTFDIEPLLYSILIAGIPGAVFIIISFGKIGNSEQSIKERIGKLYWPVTIIAIILIFAISYFLFILT